MSDSFGFGGSDAVIVLSEPGAFEPPEPVARKRVYLTASGTVGALGALSTEAATAYFQPGPAPPDGPGAFEAKDHLDLARARRIDRAGRLAATAMKLALERAEVSVAHPRAGAVVGSAFGSIDACSAFIDRFYDKGARFASPAVFPNLLPSSPVAHASIYHGLEGAVFSSADLGATAEGAIVTAAELIAADEADSMLAGAVEQHSPLVEAVMGPLCTGVLQGVRGEGAVVMLLESQQSLAARGGRAPAEIRWSRSWRGAPDLSGLPAPEGRVIVAAARPAEALEALLATTPWSKVERRTATGRAGEHECAGGFAAAAALGAIAAGEIDGALILGLAPDRGYALLLGAVESS